MAGRISNTGGIVTNGLILNLDAGKLQSYPRSGTTWNDISGNRNNGTLVNGGSGLTFNSLNGGSLVFDGIDDYSDLGNNFNFEYNNTFSVGGWFYFNNDIDITLISKQETSGNYRGWVLRKLTSYQLMIGLVNTVANQVQIRATTNLIKPNTWFHLMGTYNGSTLASGLKLYINGSQVSTTVTSNTLGSNTVLNSVSCILSLGFNGRISNVTIYNKELSASEVLRNYNATIKRFVNWGIDSDAQNFLTAALINNDTQAMAINNLVLDLKRYGIWSKMKAIYPVVGGNSFSHKFNLKDARDSDLAFRLLFTNASGGSWIHSSTGMTPNGSSDFANTYFNPSTSFNSINDSGFSFYSRTSNSFSNLPNHGIIFTNINNRLYTSVQNTFTQVWGTENVSFNVTFSNSDRRGFYTSVRTANNSRKTYKNGTIAGSNTGNDTAGSLPNGSFYIGAANIQYATSTFTNDQLAFAAFHNGLTDTEAANFYTAVQAFQTTLGRQV